MASRKKSSLEPVTFIEPMECLGVVALPEGAEWTYEIKLDGFRLEAVKNAGETLVYSRRGNVLNRKFPYVADSLTKLPDGTILDGEVVALDAQNRSDFSLLQNFKSAEARIHYFAFDILALKHRDLTQMPLEERRAILATVLPQNEHISLSVVDPSLAHISRFVGAQKLEGVIAKRQDGVYERGKRSGSWSKHRINQGQEFVIGGYTPGSNGFDALIVGFYRGKDLLFAARVRAGFVPATRRAVFERIKQAKAAKCPFANLPEIAAGRWGQGLTAEKMKECVWLKPVAVVRIDFLEWTSADHLRHTKFVALREDKDPRKVVREVN
jgi:DNA ligase D-like protein (predicted ligase)